MSFTIGGDFIPPEKRNKHSDQETKQKKSGRPVKVRKERRGNSWVTKVLNLDLSEENLVDLATRLKRSCACGGTIKEGVIEIQGEKEEELKKLLRDQGIKAQ
ncbi:MAG: stress response translation initiation inhibitor YciH [Waddliaceae bacterium]|nr:stress response translation initiation inhibitor YciH [Waddliaceae bacterium]